MLTHSQLRTLEFISSYLSSHNGVAPSYMEIGDALGLRSKSNVNRLVTALVDRGYLRRIPHRARALEVIRHPGDPSDLLLTAEERRIIEYLRSHRAAQAAVLSWLPSPGAGSTSRV